MNALRIIVLAIVALAATATSGAQIPIRLDLRIDNTLAASLGSWTNPAAIRLDVESSPGNSAVTDARISFAVTDARTGRVVVRSKDASPRVPTVDVGSGYWRGSFFGTNLIDPDAVDVDPDVRSIALATNSLPAGSYTFCIRLVDAGGAPVPTTGGCGSLTIAPASAAQLILPHDGATAENGRPLFTWLPGTPGIGTASRLRIVPVFEGQNGQTAMTGNVAIAERILPTGSTQYRYAAWDPALDAYPDAIAYAWQVATLDNARNVLSLSEVATFSVPNGNLHGDELRGNAKLDLTDATANEDNPCKEIEELEEKIRKQEKKVAELKTAWIDEILSDARTEDEEKARDAYREAKKKLKEMKEKLEKLRKKCRKESGNTGDGNDRTDPSDARSADVKRPGKEHSDPPVRIDSTGPRTNNGGTQSGVPAPDSFFDVFADLPATGTGATSGTGTRLTAANDCVDCTKITASRGTAATGGMIISGNRGSVPGGSTVTVTDRNGRKATATAEADGTFVIRESDLPDGFDHTPGNTLTIKAGGKSCTVIITR